MLRNSAGFAGTALVAQFFPASFLSAGVPGLRQQAATAPTDRLAAMRAMWCCTGAMANSWSTLFFMSAVLVAKPVIWCKPDIRLVRPDFALPISPLMNFKVTGGWGRAFRLFFGSLLASGQAGFLFTVPSKKVKSPETMRNDFLESTCSQIVEHYTR